MSEIRQHIRSRFVAAGMLPAEYFIQFYLTLNGCHAAFPVPLLSMDDAYVENARREVEERFGLKLPIEPKTDFPAFVIYDQNWEVIGGG